MVGTPSFRLALLRHELAYYRQAAGLTQQQAAVRLDCTQGRVHKIESGLTHTIKAADLTAMFEVYGVPEDEAEELRSLARTPVSTRGTWQAPLTVPRWFRRYSSLEPCARVLRAVNLSRPHGLLQCPDYLRLQFELSSGVNVGKQVAARLERQRAVFEAQTPPDCTFVMSEGVLVQTMGDPLVMLTQLRHMMTLSALPFITLLVVPFGARIASIGHEFVLLQFDSRVSSDLAYVEKEVGAEYLDTETGFRSYLRRWEFVRSAAESEADTRSLIQEKINLLEVEV